MICQYPKRKIPIKNQKIIVRFPIITPGGSPDSPIFHRGFQYQEPIRDFHSDRRKGGIFMLFFQQSHDLVSDQRIINIEAGDGGHEKTVQHVRTDRDQGKILRNPDSVIQKETRAGNRNRT